MKRRNFFKSIAIAGTAAVVAPAVLCDSCKNLIDDNRIYDYIYIGDIDTYWLTVDGLDLKSKGEVLIYCKKSDIPLGKNDLWIDNLKDVSEVTAFYSA